MIKQFFQDIRPFGQVLMITLALVFFLILSTGITLLFAACGIAPLSVTGIRLSLIVSQLLPFAGTAVLYAYLFYNHIDNCICYKKPSSPPIFSSMLWAVALFAIFVPCYQWLAEWNESWHFVNSFSMLEESLKELSAETERLMATMMQDCSFGGLALNLLIMAALPAVCEELFFRATLQRALIRWIKSKHLSVWIGAFVFSIAHGDIYGLMPRLGIGLVLGYVFLYSKSIWPSAILHFLNNAMVIVWSWLYEKHCVALSPEANIAMPSLVVVLSFLLTLGLIALWSRKYSSLDISSAEIEQ